MPLETKLIAGYTELANNYLDHIDMKIEEREQISEALKTLLGQKIESNTITSEIMEKIKPIKEILDEPENWVEDPQNIPEFKKMAII